MLKSNKSYTMIKKIYRKARNSTSKVYNSLIPKRVKVAKEVKQKYAEYEQKLAEAKQVCANSNLMTYDEFNIKDYKTSDTLFILGSGASIGDYTETMWEHIKSHDTFGFNHWYFHEHIPTYYMFELPNDTSVKEVLIHNLQVVYEKYKNIPKFLKPSNPKKKLNTKEIPKSLIKNLYYVPNYGIPKADLEEYKIALKKSEEYFSFQGIKFPDLNCKTRCSLDQVINFGIANNYKKIILCGVDLNNTDYFFKQNKFNILQHMQQLPDYQKGTVHKTLDKKYGEITIDEIILTIKNHIMVNRGMEIFVALSQSELARILPVYFYYKLINSIMKIKEENLCIGLVLPYLKSRGTEKQSLRLAKGFIEKGAKVVLFVIQGWGLDKMYQAFSQVGTEVINVGPPLDVGEKKASFSRLESLATLSRKSGCHILISRAGMTNKITGYAAKKNSIPSIIVLSGAVKSNSGINRLKKIFSFNQINRSLGSPTKIVSVSHEGAKLFAKNNPVLARKVTAIPNGIETYINGKNDSDLLLDQSKFNICFSGSIEIKRKGLDILIQSLQKLICEQKQKKISLVLIGTGEDEEAVKTLAKQSGIIDHVYFAGEQENPLAVMAQCDAFVLPSRREGLPNALLEAMSIGICSIATDCDTGPREIITHNVDGLLVPVGDAESLADAISTVLKDETQRQQLGERGRKTIQEKFSYEKMVDAYYKLVKNLCKID